MPTTDASYLKSPELIAERIQDIFKNRKLVLDRDRLDRLVDEVSKGRTFDDIRDQLDPFATSTSNMRQDRAEKSLDLDEIREALAAISGQFNLQRGQLTAQRGQVETGAKRALAALKRGQGEAITGFRSGAAGSGLLRSGLAVQDTGRITDEFARQRSQTVADRTTALRGIQSNLATLKSSETAARAARARELARSQVGTKEAIARALKLA